MGGDPAIGGHQVARAPWPRRLQLGGQRQEHLRGGERVAHRLVGVVGGQSQRVGDASAAAGSRDRGRRHDAEQPPQQGGVDDAARQPAARPAQRRAQERALDPGGVRDRGAPRSRPPAAPAPTRGRRAESRSPGSMPWISTAPARATGRSDQALDRARLRGCGRLRSAPHRRRSPRRVLGSRPVSSTSTHSSAASRQERRLIARSGRTRWPSRAARRPRHGRHPSDSAG